MKLKVIVLAAGKGTRLQTGDSDAPKVMRLACGKPLLWYVLEALAFVDKKDVIIVVGYEKDQIVRCFDGYAFAVQAEQMGTGHAVMAAAGELEGYDGAVLICYGDMPAVRRETYLTFLREHNKQKNSCTILTGESSIPLPYGRILRDPDGLFLRVVEDRDCTEQERRIAELNSGVYLFDATMLQNALGSLKNDNAQGEYYLTDVPEIISASGGRVGTCRLGLGDEIIGVNTLEQLELVSGILGKR